MRRARAGSGSEPARANQTRPLIFFAVLFGLACGTRSGERPKDENAALGGEVAARVGSETIPLSLVAEVARAQHVTAREAARHIIDDEIAAASARERGLDRRSPAAWNLVSARARLTSDRLFEEAKQKGPPTDDEVKTLSAKHWVEVDRPVTIRVTHAIVIRPKDPSLVNGAKELAKDIREGVISATDKDDFEAKAKSIALTGDQKLQMQAETLPPFADDGYQIDNQPLNPDFVKAAWSISSVGGTSPVIETKYGWHVIRLDERIPEKRMPLETRRIAFSDEVYAQRARALLEERIKALHASIPIGISPAAIQLTESVTPKRATTPSAPPTLPPASSGMPAP